MPQWRRTYENKRAFNSTLVMSKKTITAGTIVILLLFGASVYLLRQLKENEMPKTVAVVVLMNDEGFSPSEFSIKVGERVDFVNTSTVTEYWPASDLHPTHDLYTQFDPREPILPGSTWSFVFVKKGQWRMHDHLHPDKRGKIIVN